LLPPTSLLPPPPLLLLLLLLLQGNTNTLSNSLLSAIKAAGGDGKIEVSELKNLLGLVGLRKA
jgi:hypothetical protein